MSPRLPASALGRRHIILNFANVEYINSAGIATIIAILAEARQRAQQLLIVGVDWQPFKDVHFMPNLESLQYKAKGAFVVPAHHDLQARVTLYWKFTKPQS